MWCFGLAPTHGSLALSLPTPQVRSIRNARAEYGVEPARKIGAVVVAADPELRAAMAQEAAVLALLAKLEPSQVRGAAGPSFAAAACCFPGASLAHWTLAWPRVLCA